MTKLPPTSPSILSTSSSTSSADSKASTLEPIRAHPRRRRETVARLAGATPSTTAAYGGRPRTIILVEPPKERAKGGDEPKKGSKSSSSATRKVLESIGTGAGFLCYILSICCVLSGDGQSPARSKAQNGRYHHQYDDDFYLDQKLDSPRVVAPPVDPRPKIKSHYQHKRG